jgi:hypothetical protein
MQKITVAISANGFTGLTAESVEKALNHYFGSPTLKVSFSVTEVVEFAALIAAGNAMAERIQMLKSYQNVCRSDKTILSIEKIFTSDDAAALAQWEQVTK